MKKTILVLTLILFSIIGLSQNKSDSTFEFSDRKIYDCTVKGENVIQKLYIRDSTYLYSILDTNITNKILTSFDSSNYKIMWNIYYDFKKDLVVFVFFSGKSISNGTPWGLFKYNFIIDININHKLDEVEIVDAQAIFDNQIAEKKLWWISLMNTYMDKRNKRDEWQDKFGFPTPPPPPPESADWLEE